MMNPLFLWPIRHPLRTARNIRKWVGNPCSQQDVIFIVGAPRSGTTLLKTLLVAHSDLAGSKYESTGLFRIRDFCSYKMGELPQQHIQDRVAAHRHVVSLFDQLTADLLQQESARRFVDKLTVRRWRLSFVTRHFPNASFLNIVRDGRDCLCSARKHPNVRQSESVAGFARYWKYCVETVDSQIAPSQRYTVRYEDLTADPQACLSQIMNWLGMQPQAGQLDPTVYSPIIAKREVHQNLRKAVNTSSHQRWRRDLSAEDAAAFQRIAGDALRIAGYCSE